MLTTIQVTGEQPASGYPHMTNSCQKPCLLLTMTHTESGICGSPPTAVEAVQTPTSMTLLHKSVAAWMELKILKDLDIIEI